MGKVEIGYFSAKIADTLNFVFAEMFIECLTFLASFILILYFDWLLGPHKEQNFEKKKKKNQNSSPQKLSIG